MDDKTIMEIMEQDEEKGFSLLIDRYTSYVTAIIGGIAKSHLNSSDIEEVAADVFFKVWCNRNQINTQSTRAFIAQISRNAAIDRLRMNRVEFLPYDDDILIVSNAGQPDRLAIVNEQMQILEEAVESFTEPDREIFIRFYYFGEPIKAIAGRLKLNAATTKTRLHRARSRIREIMRERGYSCV